MALRQETSDNNKRRNGVISNLHRNDASLAEAVSMDTYVSGVLMHVLNLRRQRRIDQWEADL